MTDTQAGSDRIHKLLAAAGVGSRRQVEKWIRDGQVTVNGAPARIGQRVSPADRFRVNGERVRIDATPRTRRVLLYHKRTGEVCTRRDPESRPTVFDALPALSRDRWVAVGRLDINTAGLLLFTNDGALANRLMHPSSQVEREYAVRVLGDFDGATLARLRKGVTLSDGPARFGRVEIGGGDGANRWYHVTLTEGRQREVRRLWEAVGGRVNRLIRVRYGNVRLDRGLAAGAWRELNNSEIEALSRLSGKERPARRRDARPQGRFLRRR